jgi:large subunit ribosomal protein L25
MAEIITLTATQRAQQGTRPARRLRAEGKVPAVVYGLGTDPIPVTVQWKELRAALTTDQGLNAVVHLEVDGDRTPTLVKDIQRHPVRRDVLHVDFLRVDLSKPVDADVHIVLEGEADAVLKVEGGMVEQVLTSVTVTAKPDDIPPQITVDVSGLEVGDTIRVGDLSLPEGVTLATDPEEPVVSAQVVHVEVPEPEEGEEAEAAEGEEAEAAEGEAAEGEGDAGGHAEGGDTEG